MSYERVMQTQYLELNEGRLAYTDYGGSGPLVLMLPGMAALRSEYRFLAPKLSAAGFRPVSVDLCGQGDSSVPWPVYDVPSTGSDILALIEHLDDHCAHLIGTSFSAAPSVWAAVERPELVRSIGAHQSFCAPGKNQSADECPVLDHAAQSLACAHLGDVFP